MRHRVLPATWKGLGLDQANEVHSLTILETLFASLLEGHPLIGRADPDGKAHWLNFRTLTNRTWYRDNFVLLGDAAHTTHYSIGAGTALALGDAAFLVEAIHSETRLQSALALYERQRMSSIRLTQRAARNSARWFENLSRYISLPPSQLCALLSQRHSPVLPHIPPRLYYQMDRAAEWLSSQVTRPPNTESQSP